MKYNPALHLEYLSKTIDELHVKIYELKSDGLDYSVEKNELEALNDEFDLEFEKVKLEYLDLFNDFYYTTEDIQTMLDLDVQMVTKHMAKKIDCIEFSKCIRRYIKGCRITKAQDSLEALLRSKNIDIDKKIFFSRKSLLHWLMNHVTVYDGTPITLYFALKMIEDRNTPSVLNTVSFMNENNLKYDMQLKRKGRQRLYFHMERNVKRKLSRIPVNQNWDFEILKLMESIE